MSRVPPFKETLDPQVSLGRFRRLCREAFRLWVRILRVVNAKTWFISNAATAIYRTLTRGRQRLIVVTGSLGKTSTTRAIMSVLGQGPPAWVHAQDNCFGLICRNLVRQAACSSAVLEVGIGGPGQMKRYGASLRPDLVVITAIASDHIGRFAGAEGLWQEKAAMVRALGSEGVAVLNGDDPAVRRMAGLCKGRIFSFGLTPGCDVHAMDLRIGPMGTRFRLVADDLCEEVNAQVVGPDAVRALVAAALIGRLAGIDLATIIGRLEQVAPTPGRMQPMPLLSGAVAWCDDFKAGDENVHSAIDCLETISEHRRIVVLGSLYRPRSPRGERYRLVGHRVASFADRIILVGWRASLYLRGVDSLPAGVQLDRVRSVEEAIQVLEAVLAPGDVVLIKGRGEEKLARIALGLAGDPIACRLPSCELENILCQDCPHARSRSLPKDPSDETGQPATSCTAVDSPHSELSLLQAHRPSARSGRFRSGSRN